MEKCRIGVVGIGRGKMMVNYCKDCDNAVLVAICDKWEHGLEKLKNQLNDDSVKYFTDFSEFLKCDMDVVVLANYANEHAPFAIAAMNAGKDVISEVLPVQNMAEAVALIECCEKTGRKYRYAENYCYMSAPLEMKNKYRAGELGEFEYGEGEYLHNCESLWTSATYGERNHWRNHMTAFFYCTHSVGPILHITGMRPCRVSGFEMPFNARMARMGARAGNSAVEMVTLENGSLIKSLHGVGCSKCSVWYSVYGSKGRIESAREDAGNGDVDRIYTNLDKTEGENANNPQNYLSEYSQDAVASKHGHGGSDYYCLHNAIDSIRGVEDADVIDVYEAINMWMCGFFAYISVLDGGVSVDIPDMRDPSAREAFRNDFRCTDPSVAKDQLLPSYSKGTPDIPDAIYDIRRAEWENKQK